MWAIETSAAAMASARSRASMSACASCRACAAMASASASSFASKASFRARSAFCLSAQISVSWLRRLRMEAARWRSHWSAVLLSSAVHGFRLSLGLASKTSFAAPATWARSRSSAAWARRRLARSQRTSSRFVRACEGAGCSSGPCAGSCETSSVSLGACTLASSASVASRRSLVTECTGVPQLSSELRRARTADKSVSDSSEAVV
mmetsp:Transcript_77699/g.214740  ORF Transcript_77699/g.214740 Transcript_77699/m.214740 type:complete len:206 (+) Transcript_77699:1224-1841(+)